MKNQIDIIDCLGNMCPIPMIKIETKLNSIRHGESFMVITDHGCTITSIKEKYDRNITKIDEVMNGVWEVFLKK